MRIKGKICQWQDAKGFGFIEPPLKGERVFLHISAIQNRVRRPILGDVVTYTVSQDNQGRAQANQVTFAGEALKLRAAKPSTLLPLGFVLLFFLLLSIGVLLGKLAAVIVLGYVLLSLLTYVFYWWDKRKAQAKQWRTQESTLQLLSLLGGWPGALLAQRYLRHKSKKQTFRVMYWVTVASNLLLLSYFIAKW